MLTLFLVISYIDRVNVGFAKLRMMSDLNFDDAVYGLGAGLFFITYSLLQAPSNWVIHRVGARLTVSALMIAWSLTTIGFFFIQTRWEFYILRLILGAAEAGFYPGMLLYLTYWFPSRWRGKAGAVFIMAVPLAGIIGGPLSGWLLDSFHGIKGLEGWRWMFLVEGTISLVFGIAAWFLMPNGVKDANWLSKDEKAEVESELSTELSKMQLSPYLPNGWTLLRSGLLWKMTGVIFFGAIGLNALTFWLPTLVSETGTQSPFAVGLLSTIPYLFSCLCMLLVGTSSDKHLERRFHIALPFLAAAIALALSTQFQTNLVASIVLLSVSAGGILTVLPVFWTLPSTVLTGKHLAIGIGLINMIANSAGFISPYMIGWLRVTFHSSVGAVFVLSGAMIIGAIIVLTIPKRLR